MSVLSFRNVFIVNNRHSYDRRHYCDDDQVAIIAPLSAHLISRWFASVARGRVLHSDVAQVTLAPHELVIAVPVHYLIGITLALAYCAHHSPLGLSPRNPVAALRFGLCTNLLPWLLMLPAMGYGWFGVEGSPPTRLFALANHIGGSASASRTATRGRVSWGKASVPRGRGEVLSNYQFDDGFRVFGSCGIRRAGIRQIPVLKSQ